jgi:hypothetical protein
MYPGYFHVFGGGVLNLFVHFLFYYYKQYSNKYFCGDFIPRCELAKSKDMHILNFDIARLLFQNYYNLHSHKQ